MVRGTESNRAPDLALIGPRHAPESPFEPSFSPP